MCHHRFGIEKSYRSKEYSLHHSGSIHFSIPNIPFYYKLNTLLSCNLNISMYSRQNNSRAHKNDSHQMMNTLNIPMNIEYTLFLTNNNPTHKISILHYHMSHRVMCMTDMMLVIGGNRSTNNLYIGNHCDN